MLHLLTPLLSLNQTADWSTTYERSNYLDTGRYQEALDYCRRIDRASEWAKVVNLGKSPEGREMIALIISKEGAFTPSQSRKSSKPFVVINNGIHSGEIEGKDADLILAREICITKKEQALVDTVNLAIIPVFSVDAHERFGAYNRINQNGPREMGWRVTSRNLNLNRDFVKADALEMKNMIRFLRDWNPDFLFDNHTSDGADFQYTMMAAVPTEKTLADPVAAWSRRMLTSVLPAVERDGFLTGPYFDLFDRADPSKGIGVSDYAPRFSTGYMSALNRPSMLVETHMLKPYKERVESTYSINKHTILHCGRTARELKAAIKAADEDRPSKGKQVVLATENTGEKRPFTFKGFEYAPYDSAASGTKMAAWKQMPKDFQSFIMDTFKPSIVVEAPAGYILPAAWTEAIDLLDIHGIQYDRITRGGQVTGESYRFDEVKFGQAPFEGRFQPEYKAVKITETRLVPSGSVFVPADQVRGKLAMHLLEPAGPDALVRWGFFNAMFERKEYFEDYAMAPLAEKMMAADPTLKAEFEERLKDPKFAADPNARLQFFFERSEYEDERYSKYPVLMVASREAALLR